MGICHPVREPLLLDGLGHPRRRLQVLEHFWNSIHDFDKPRRDSLSDKLRIRPPAEFVRVHDLAFNQEMTTRPEILENCFVCSLDILSGVVCDF